MKKIIIPILMTVIFMFVALCNITYAQGKFGVGGYIGGGFLSGDSPNVGSYTSSLFFEVKTPFSESVYPRVSFIYTQDFNRLVPGSTKDYFPFLKGFSLKGVASQNISESYFVEEGAGFITLNDHTFNNIDEWNFGVVTSLLIGFDLRNEMMNGWKIGAGAEFAFSFANTFAKYYSFHVQAEYLF